MKTSAPVWAVAALAVACSSDPENPAGVGGSGGQAGTPTAGAGGGSSGVTGGGASAGGVATGGGTAVGGGGASTGGTGGAATGGIGGSGGTGGVGGVSAGASGAAGSAGSGSSNIPADYQGTPFGGTPQTIPGKIEIEKYDLGGANVAFKADPGGAFDKCGFKREDALKLQCTQQAGSPDDKSLPGCGAEPAGQIYLGYIGAGNWYKYTVNVTETATYVISGHEGVAGNTQMQFTFTEQLKTGNITLPSTDMCGHEAYHVWATHPSLGEITLPAGKYVLTVNVVAAAMNLDWFAFTKKP